MHVPAMVLAVALGGTAAKQELAAAEVVDRVVAAYGGEKALRAAVAVRQSGTVVSPTRGKAAMTRAFAWPTSLRVEVAFPGEAPEVRVLTSGAGWRNGERADGPKLVAMMLQAMRMGLPLLLLDRKASVTDGGAVERDGRPLRALSLRLGANMALDVEVDTATWQLASSTGRSGPLTFVARYGDFRVVSGVLFAFREETEAMGSATGVTVLEKVEVLPALPKETFAP